MHKKTSIWDTKLATNQKVSLSNLRSYIHSYIFCDGHNRPLCPHKLQVITSAPTECMFTKAGIVCKTAQILTREMYYSIHIHKAHVQLLRETHIYCNT